MLQILDNPELARRNAFLLDCAILGLVPPVAFAQLVVTTPEQVYGRSGGSGGLMTISQDRSLLAWPAPGARYQSNPNDRAHSLIEIRSAETGALVKTIPVATSGHLACFLDEDRKLLTADLTSVLEIEIDTARITRIFQEQRAALAVSSDSNHAALLNNNRPLTESVAILDLQSGEYIHFVGPSTTNGWVRCAAFSSDGKFLATAGDDNRVSIWEVDTGSKLATLIGHGSEIFNVQCFDSDTKLLSSAHDATRIWDLAKRATVQELPASVYSGNSTAAVVAPDGSRVSVNNAAVQVTEFDIATGEPIVTISLDAIGVAKTLYYSAEGTRLIVADYDHLEALELDSGKPIYTAGGSDGLDILRIPRNNTLAMINSGPHIRLWDLDSGANLQKVDAYDGSPYSHLDAALSPDETVIAISSSKNVRGSDPGRISIVDASTLDLLLQFMAHTGNVNGLAFSPDSTSLATASDDHTVNLWKLATGEEIRTFTGHSGRMYDVAFLPDAPKLVGLSWPRGKQDVL